MSPLVRLAYALNSDFACGVHGLCGFAALLAAMGAHP
jgi:hypothetical protein